MAQKRKLNQDLIVREAIALMQEGGLEALTLRKLAERLDARAPSLARHVGDKGRLIALVSSTIFQEALDLIPGGLSGNDWYRAFGLALRQKQAETRDITALVATVPPFPDIDERIVGRLRSLMADAGLQGEKAQLRQSAIQAFVTGWMVFETSPRKELFARRVPSDHGFEDALDALIAGFDVKG